jgi:hypothetical protein
VTEATEPNRPTAEQRFWLQAETAYQLFLDKLDNILDDLQIAGDSARIATVNHFFGSDVSEHYEEWIGQDRT